MFAARNRQEALYLNENMCCVGRAFMLTVSVNVLGAERKLSASPFTTAFFIFAPTTSK